MTSEFPQTPVAGPRGTGKEAGRVPRRGTAQLAGEVPDRASPAGLTSPAPAGEKTPASAASASAAEAGPRSWTIELEPGTPIISANARLNRYAKNRQTQDLKETIRQVVKYTRPGLATEGIGRSDITVTYHSPPRLKRLRHPLASGCITDSDNIAPTAKALVDGLVQSGIFPGDSRKWVRRVVYELGPVHPRGQLTLTITEIGAA